MKVNPQYRPAALDDGPALSDLAFVSKASHGYTDAFMEACREELTWSASDIGREDAIFLVAEHSDEMMGFAVVIRTGGDEAELEALFVSPSRMGLGIGRELLKRVAEIARAEGIQSLSIQSDPDAVPFYEKLGARLVGHSPSGSIPGRILPDLILNVDHLGRSEPEHDKPKTTE